MKSFCGFFWDQDNLEAHRRASQLIEAAKSLATAKLCRAYSEGFYLYDLSVEDGTQNAVDISLEDEARCGILFGTLFPTSAPHCALQSISDNSRHAAFNTRGASIIRDFWGSYVGFLQTGRGVAVVIDPTAGVPCYFANLDGVLVVFSHLEDCTFLHTRGFTINYAFIHKLLAYDKIQNGETGLNEIRELLGGQRLSLQGSRTSVDRVWDPRSIKCDNRRFRSREECMHALREITGESVNAWASQYESITVGLSGGLDSAIVLSCLANGPHKEKIRAVHYQLDSEDWAEKEYAAAAANWAGVDCKEIFVSADAALPTLASHPLSVRPYRQFIANALAEHGTAQDVRTPQAQFTGQGGDHLFLHSSSSLNFYDYVSETGFNTHTLKQLYWAARLSEQSIWKVLQQCLAVAFTNSDSELAASVQKRESALVTGEGKALVPSEMLPDWALSRGRVPPAKFDQICRLNHMVQVRSQMRVSEKTDLVHPLISQPLIETSLSIPTYLLCDKGVSRGLVRDAFSGLIPDAIRLRRTKGEASRFFNKRIAESRQQILDALVGGELSRSRLLDDRDIESFVEQDRFRFSNFARKALVFYSIEAWLRRWTSVLAGADRDGQLGSSSAHAGANPF